MFGVEKIKDPFYEDFSRSVFSELASKYGETVENKDSKGLKVFSPEDALRELKELLKDPQTKKHF
jgi:hypothetical protein